MNVRDPACPCSSVIERPAVWLTAISGAAPRTASGKRCSTTAVVFGASTSSPNENEVALSVAELMLTVTTWDWPDVSVNCGGVTLPTPAGRPAMLADHSTLPAARLVTVRVTVQTPTQLRNCRLGMFSVAGLPPVAGLAAVKFGPVSFITSPARVARVRSTRPPPRSKGSLGTVAGVVALNLNTPAVFAVDISADLTSIGVQVGCTARTSAAAPATCGVDIEVPLSRPVSLLPFGSRQHEKSSRVQRDTAARTLTPGPVMSGFSRSTLAGPIRLNDAITSAWPGKDCPGKAMVAVALAGSVARWARIAAERVVSLMTHAGTVPPAPAFNGTSERKMTPIAPAVAALLTRAMVPHALVAVPQRSRAIPPAAPRVKVPAGNAVQPSLFGSPVPKVGLRISGAVIDPPLRKGGRADARSGTLVASGGGAAGATNVKLLPKKPRSWVDAATVVSHGAT